MIDFNEELARFKPSREVSKIEEELIKTDITDVQDILLSVISENSKGDK